MQFLDILDNFLRTSLIAQLVKNPPSIQETLVQFLGQEDLLENGQATHSSILGLLLWLSWQRIHLQCGRAGFNPWVGKFPWRRERLPTPVFWLEEFHGLCSPWDHKKVRHNWVTFCLLSCMDPLLLYTFFEMNIFELLFPKCTLITQW